MKKKIRGWSIEETPHWHVFCEECKYLFTVCTHFRDDTFKYSDIYESCTQPGPRGRTAYLFNHSDRGGDYSSGIEFHTLVSRYIASTHGWE